MKLSNLINKTNKNKIKTQNKSTTWLLDENRKQMVRRGRTNKESSAQEEELGAST